jgi:MFS family permease
LDSAETPSAGASQNKKPGLYYGYIIVLITFLMMVLGWGIFYIYGVFFTPLTREFGWSRAVTSGAFSASILISGLSGILAGRLSDRFGPRIVIIFCTISLSLGYALMSLVHNVWEFYLIYAVLIAAGIGGFWSPLVAAVARWFSGKRGLMTGIVSGGISFGTLILPPIATQLISAFNWRTTYLIISLVILVIVMIAVRFLRNSPAPGSLPDRTLKRTASSPAAAAPVFTFKEALATRQFWMVSIIYVCFGFIQLTVMVHIVPFATGAGISDISAAVILSIIGGASLTGRIVMGFVTDRLKVKPSAILCLALLTFAVVWLQFSSGIWQLYLFAVVFGFGYGGLSCLQSLIAAELYGLLSLGVITAIFSFSFDLGGAVGPVLAGLIYDLSRSYQWAFAVCLAVVAIALIISLTLKPPVKK